MYREYFLSLKSVVPLTPMQRCQTIVTPLSFGQANRFSSAI